MAGVVLLSRSTRPCDSMHGHAWSFSEQVIASVIDDSRCGMSDVAFRTVQPVDGLSCCITFTIGPISETGSGQWVGSFIGLDQARTRWLIANFGLTTRSSQLWLIACLITWLALWLTLTSTRKITFNHQVSESNTRSLPHSPAGHFCYLSVLLAIHILVLRILMSLLSSSLIIF